MLLAGRVDAVLVSVAGDARRDPAVRRPPPLQRGVEAIGLGQRPLVLLHHPGQLWRASQLVQDPTAWDESPCRRAPCGRQPMGYLLPPRASQPLLHRALQREGRLPVHSFSSQEHSCWLEQLAAEPLLLPAHLSLLTLPRWREVGLTVRQPLTPLTETLWLLLRRGEAQRPELARLLRWWGGSRRRQTPRGPSVWQWPAGPMRWWWWR